MKEKVLKMTRFEHKHTAAQRAAMSVAMGGFVRSECGFNTGSDRNSQISVASRKEGQKG